MRQGIMNKSKSKAHDKHAIATGYTGEMRGGLSCHIIWEDECIH